MGGSPLRSGACDPEATRAWALLGALWLAPTEWAILGGFRELLWEASSRPAPMQFSNWPGSSAMTGAMRASSGSHRRGSR